MRTPFNVHTARFGATLEPVWSYLVLRLKAGVEIPHPPTPVGLLRKTMRDDGVGRKLISLDGDFDLAFAGRAKADLSGCLF